MSAQPGGGWCSRTEGSWRALCQAAHIHHTAPLQRPPGLSAAKAGVLQPPPGRSPKLGISTLMLGRMALGEVTRALLSRTGKEHLSPVPVPAWSLGGREGPASRCTARVTRCGAVHGATKGRWWSVGQSQSWPGDVPRAPGRGAWPWHCSSPARSPRKTPPAPTVLTSWCQPACISTACCVVWRH